MSVTFLTEEDRREVLARAASLVMDRKSNIQVNTTNIYKLLIKNFKPSFPR